MADIDVSGPGDTDVVANFPAEERASRAAILAAVNGTATWGGTSSGSADAQTVTVSLTGWTLTSGAAVDFIAGFANTTTTPTFKVNSTTAKTVVNKDGDALVAGDIKLSRQHSVRYDGTNWRLQDPALSNPDTRMSQTLYDILYPVGEAVQFTKSTSAPDLPDGITATWTRDTTANYIRVASGSPGSGGSLTTAGSGVLTTDNQDGTGTGMGDGGFTGVRNPHTHDIASHTHTYEPSYTSVCKWDRTA